MYEEVNSTIAGIWQDWLRKVDHQRLVGGPVKIQGTARKFPWQPCQQEPVLLAATNQHLHTEGT